MSYLHTLKQLYDKHTGTVTLYGPCYITGKEHCVTVPFEGFRRWCDGELIQNALPLTSREDREFLISGISPEGWQQMFGGNDVPDLDQSVGGNDK